MKRLPFPLLWSAALLAVVLGLLLAACGGPATPTLTPLPTATPTPRSTPIPPVPTAIPLATEDNPLVVLMLPQGTRRAATNAADELEALILELSGLVVDVQVVNSYGEIVAQLCGAAPVVGWVDGVSYVVAEAQACADPALLVRRNEQRGFRVDMLASAELAEGDLGDLAGEDFCRVDAEDVVSWLVPSLMLYTAGVNPLYDLGEIIDVGDYDAVVAGIYNGECLAGAVPHDFLDEGLGEALQDLEDLSERVIVLDTSLEFPYDILVYPQTVPLNVRIPLSDVFVQIAVDDERASVLAAILQQDELERVDRADFSAFRNFMEQTGLNYAALGE